MDRRILMLAGLLALLASCDRDEADPTPMVDEPILLSYESVSDNFKVKATYEYDAEDRVEKISWERSNHGTTTGSNVFVYDDAGKLKEQIRYIEGMNYETIKFSYDNNKIFASATYSNGNKTTFSFYDYNDEGQLENVEIYRADGPGFLRADSIGFTYHPDGNLQGMFKYTFDPVTERLVLISTETFSEYLQSPNPVATVEILPVVDLQKTLPKDYTVANNGGSTHIYTMHYDLRPDGYPRERTVTSGGTVETTVYKYDR